MLTDQGVREVRNVLRRTTGKLVKLEVEDGRSITVTEEHPIFTRNGWVPAKDALGEYLMDFQSVSYMQSSVRIESRTKESMLLKILLSEESVVGRQWGVEEEIIEHGQGKPPVLGHRIEDARRILREDSERKCGEKAAGTRGERPRHDSHGGTASSALAERICVELRDKVGWEARRLSYLLQSGFWESENEACDRGGREISQRKDETGARQKEGGSIRGARVESVSHIECGSAEEVWNLEVTGTPHFYADGFLVHNCHKFKNTQTQRFKLLKPYLRTFRRRWTLTGTPAPNGLMDIFGQIYCLDEGHALGSYITKFRDEYFDAGGFGGFEWTLKPGARKRIYKKIAPLILRISDKVLKDELPKLVFNDIKVTLPPKAMTVYREMETLLVTMLNDGTRIRAANTGVAAGKCLQIANGGVFYDHDDGVGEVKKKIKNLHTAKIDAMVDLIDEIQHKPVLVLYSYVHDKLRLKKQFPGAPCIADMSEKKADLVFDKWNRGEIPVLLAQSASVSHGLNLQGGGQHIVWFGLPWDLTTWLQAIRRLYRQGSEFSHIFVHTLIAEGTIDEVVRQVLKSKDRSQNALMRAVRSIGLKIAC